MDKGINLQIAEYKANLLNVINKSNMPICITETVLSELLYKEIKPMSARAIREERMVCMKERGEQNEKED